jgi:hypothetical protein
MRPRNPKIRSSRFHAGDRVAQIVVLRQSGLDQLLQIRVFENLPPLKVGERSRL